MRYPFLLVLLVTGCVERPEPDHPAPESDVSAGTAPFDAPLEDTSQEATGSFAVTATVDVGGRIHHAPQVWGLNTLWTDPRGARSINDAGTLPDGGRHAPLSQDAAVGLFFSRFDRGTPDGGLANLRLLGARDLRYPGGCPADDYEPARAAIPTSNDPALHHAYAANGGHAVHQALTPGDLLLVAERLDDGRGVTVTWQVNANVLGGNPCGKADLYPPATGTDEAMKRTQRRTRLLADLDKVIAQFKNVPAGRLARLRAFEIGNEQWSARTTAEVDAYFSFADAAAEKLRTAFQDKPLIYLQAYPVTGNNQTGSRDAAIQAYWDQQVAARLYRQCGGGYSCYDAITDHYYGTAQQAPDVTNLAHVAPPGMAARWAARELVDVLPASLIKYSPKAVAATEWNLKCWSTARTDVVRTYGIDEDPASWWPVASANALGSITAATPPATLSGQALKVTMLKPASGQSSHYLASREIPVSPTVPTNPGAQGYLKAGRNVVLSTQVYAPRPVNTYVQLSWRMPDGTYVYPARYWWPRQLKSVPASTWRRVAVRPDEAIPAGATHVRIELGVLKSAADWASDATDVVAWFDDIFVETNCDDIGGRCSRASRATGSNLSGGTLDQALALTEGLLAMARHGQPTSAAHLHVLSSGGYYPPSGTDYAPPFDTMDRQARDSCALFTPDDKGRPDDGPLTAAGLAFQFTSPLAAGDSSVVTLGAGTPTFTVPRYLERRDLECTGIACLRPCEGAPTEDGGTKKIYPVNCTAKKVPEVSVYGGIVESQRKVYAFVINRHASQSAAMALDFTGGQYVGFSRFLSQRITTLQGTRGYLSRIDYAVTNAVPGVPSVVTLKRNEITVGTTAGTRPATGTKVEVMAPPMSALRVELGY
ncbi:hypothetical protein [Pyxidicoccus xibeiensis]|uniref:hypothetical protein n=1 Tax=Pyxidicoccus xibeiensis TaxID=2906759 RepID=UPI0020A82EC1|nr:hypothetical protein [Pyxidicoccus xibeiensis]MCP3142055.1 hypothetical protein [Pyxidicoccus xibeiensis]